MKKLCTRNVLTHTDTELIKRCHKQDVYKESKSSLQVSEHVQRQHALGPHSLCLVGRFHSQAAEHFPTVYHGCPRGLLKPCSTHSNRSIHVLLSQTFAASRLRSTLSVGSHAMLRLVPIVLILQALLACKTQLRHHRRIPCRVGYAIPVLRCPAILL